jgi:hypothetical protein
VVEDVVFAVRTDVCAEALVKVTDVGERLHVAGLVAPEGELVMEQVSVTVPVNELAGVMVIVDVLPLVAPGGVEILPLLVSVKLLPESLGASQKPAHPATKPIMSGAAASITPLHFPALIASPQ